MFPKIYRFLYLWSEFFQKIKCLKKQFIRIQIREQVDYYLFFCVCEFFRGTGFFELIYAEKYTLMQFAAKNGMVNFVVVNVLFVSYCTLYYIKHCIILKYLISDSRKA